MSRQSAGEARRDAARDLLSPVVAQLGLEVEEVTLTPAGSRRVLRVVVDATEDAVDQRALSLDVIAEASKAVSEALDESTVMGGEPYVLEVSSPGLDRPLTRPRHFRRNLRRKVIVTLADGSEVTGRVVSADDALELTVEGPKKGMTAARTVVWADAVSAVVQLDFKRLDDDPANPDEPTGPAVSDDSDDSDNSDDSDDED